MEKNNCGKCGLCDFMANTVGLKVLQPVVTNLPTNYVQHLR